MSRLANKVKKGTTMFYEDDEELDLVGNTTIEDDETTEPEEEEVEEVEEEEVKEDTKDEKDSKVQALDSERARRKAAEKELKELRAKLEQEKNKEEDEKAFNSKREDLRKKLLEKDVMDEEVADTILSALGDDLIKTSIASERKTKEENFDRALSELKQDEMFMDADTYKPQIRELMDKGLSIEEAYFASVGKSRFSQMKKDLEVELEQKLLNNGDKADKIDIGHAEEKGAIKRGKYTKREQEIARETGLTVEEVHKRYIRPGEVFSIEDMENL